MTQKTQTKQNPQSQNKFSSFFKKLFRGNKILWAGLIFFSIPLIILAIILIQSSLATGNVIEGNRFNNDLNPEITQTLVSEVEASLNSFDVESVSVNLKAATLRVTLQLSPVISEENFALMATEAIEKVDSILPLDTYFTSSDAKKMYDIEINVYNTISANDDTVLYHTILLKNGNMETWSIQDLSTALNPELAAELLAAMEAKNNPVEADTTTNIPTDAQATESTTTE